MTARDPAELQDLIDHLNRWASEDAEAGIIAASVTAVRPGEFPQVNLGTLDAHPVQMLQIGIVILERACERFGMMEPPAREFMTAIERALAEISAIADAPARRT